MIQGVSAAYMIPYPTGGQVAGRKLSVPVRPLLASTTVFKHVIGVPARPPMKSTPVFKVQLLDTMIDRLTRMGGKTEALQREISIDERITTARKLIQWTEGTRRPFTAGLALETGLIVNQTA